MLLSLSNAFIKRPVLSTVCTIVIILLGTISVAVLPLDKLPEIAPKKVAVTANYIGADAKTTEDNVTTVLEREINGTEQVRWIDSFQIIPETSLLTSLSPQKPIATQHRF